jgi:hypothetical protein
MFTWCTLRTRDSRIETIDRWPTLGEVLRELACWSWEEPANNWLSFVVEEASGLVVAIAIFGPEGALLVTVSDGRRLCSSMPEFYREVARPEATPVLPCPALTPPSARPAAAP